MTQRKEVDIIRKSTMLFHFSRLLLLVMSLSVWHQQANELLSTRTLNVNQCILSEPLLLIFLILHFAYTAYSYHCFEKLSLLYSVCNILLGSFILMAIKPPKWFYSFKNTNCYELYEDNNVINRYVYFAYALIVLGALESLATLKSKVFITLLFVSLFLACTLMQMMYS